MSTVLLIIALAFSIASLYTNWSTARTLRRVEESTDALEDAVFKAEGQIASLRGELRGEWN